MLKRALLVNIGLFLLLLAGAPRFCYAQTNIPANVQSTLQKDELTLLITDSGLGGLSVCSAIEQNAEQRKSYKNITMIFCNALPEANYGYNNIESEKKKGEVFSTALEGMVQWYHPDLVLIACNTLSVVYPQTSFSKTSSVPVLGIVELGADLLYSKMQSDTSSSVVIFGTETTIAANSHKSLLQEKGISTTRIIPEACVELAGEIQSNSKSDMVMSMVDMYVSDAVSSLEEHHKNKIFAGFCCTHYGYVASTFLDAFKTAGITNVEVVNPNETMAMVVVNGSPANRFPQTSISVKVTSRAPLSKEEIASIASLIQQEGPKTAEALRQYELKRDLFSFERE